MEPMDSKRLEMQKVGPGKAHTIKDFTLIYENGFQHTVKHHHDTRSGVQEIVDVANIKSVKFWLAADYISDIKFL